ncbi:hypothetical protein IB229_13165 [Pseudomonas sp. PDM14]|uniref:hypothetical protein n=1 Tax=Pseudomonas sp. PDM14 TaxID=2769288 RepID=UPI001781B74B|nr:hypothetical protein [Pseudomonas sp. PDM14]MBD9483927.1 hypothetical protein [Pseudomonas sp. PDM14]
MPDAVDVFLECCQHVVAGNHAWLARLQAQGFTCAPGEWAFSLPALHGFMVREMGGGAPDYQSFIRALFASDINQQLGEQGMEIAIAENLGKVNLSRYCLRRRSP